MVKQAPSMHDIRRVEPVRPLRHSRWLKRFRAQQRTAIALVALALVAGLATAGYAMKHQNSGSSTSNNVNVVIAEVSKHYLLPANETPALATVTDTSKLTSPFFKKSQNGDKVLIYQTNQVAIIYRPKIDRIIAVGPVSIDTPPSATSSKH